MAIKRKLTIFSAASLATLLALAILLPGCGADKAKMQSFVDGYLNVMEALQSNPEVAQTGREAAMKYASSGYTDLESAKKAQQSFEESIKKDQAALVELKAVEKPDETSKKMSKDLQLGVEEVDEGNRMLADNYAKAPGQSVEQRAATAADIGGAMKLYVEGMGKIVSSLALLETYIKDNGLQGGAEAKKWHDQIEQEMEIFKGYSQ